MAAVSAAVAAAVGEVTASAFGGSGDDYDRFMGRWSRRLAAPFAAFAGVRAGQRALDVGCGPGALTGTLVDLVGADAVAGCDPSPSFVTDCGRRHPGVRVVWGSAERLPFPDASFDVTLAQLVLHFVTDPDAAATEAARVTKPGGVVAACVWDAVAGMGLLSAFWAAAGAAGGSDRIGLEYRFGAPGELSAWLSDAGFADVTETTLAIESTYAGFDELWPSLLGGVGPAAKYTVELSDAARARLRGALFEQVGSPTSAFTLEASVWAVRGVRADQLK